MVIVRTVVADTLVDVESTALTVTVLVPAGVTEPDVPEPDVPEPDAPEPDVPLALVLPPPHPTTSVIPSNNIKHKLLAFENCRSRLFAPLFPARSPKPIRNASDKRSLYIGLLGTSFAAT
jgi:hypothetical protein